MIELRKLQFHYPRSSFSLQLEHTQVESGEHVALIGPSGCGKTTLLNLLAAVLLPDSGSVDLAGESVTALSDAQRRDFRIRTLPLRIGRGLSVTVDMQQRVEILAARLGIADKLDRHPGQLSQGERVCNVANSPAKASQRFSPASVSPRISA